MGIQAGKYIIIILVATILSSCQQSQILEIETVSKLALKNRISLFKKVEKWNNFNGNGYKILIYQIKDNQLSEIIKQAHEQKYKQYRQNHENITFENSEISPYISESAGFYMTIWQGNEIRTILIDSTHSKLIYFFNVL